MKFSAAAVIAVAALANAQTLADIPSCAKSCLDDSVKKNTQCGATDVACICKSFDAIQGDATPCVLKACGSDTAINKVLPATKALCANPPSGGSSSSASAPASSAPASSAPASSAPASSAPASSASQPASSASDEPEPTGTDEPSQPAETSSVQQTTDCGSSSAVVPTAAPSAPANGTSTGPSAPIVTAGAAGLVPATGLAILAVAAFLL